MTAEELSIPYELTIGVTGHRRLADPQAVEHAVERLLEQVHSILDSGAGDRQSVCPADSSHARWMARVDSAICGVARLLWRVLRREPRRAFVPARTPIDWTVVSSLAQGADRIVARAVLQRPRGERPPRLHAILPMAVDDYRQDFTEPADLEEFDELWKVASSQSTEASADTGARTTTARGEARNQCYLRGGQQVVDRCEILIAVWNGEPAAGVGGTAEIVDYAIRMGRKVLWIDSNHLDRTARLLVPRADAESPNDSICVGKYLALNLPMHAKELSTNFHRLAAYNRDASKETGWPVALTDQRTKLEKCADQSGLPPGSLDCLQHLLPHFVRADQLAQRYQRRYVMTAKWLQRLSSLAVTMVVVQTLFFPHQSWMVIGEMMAMLLAVALLRISQSEGWHEKWLRDRYFSELLRLTIFTSLAGIRRPAVSGSTTGLLPFYHSADDWIPATCRRLLVDAAPQISMTANLAARKRFLIDAWLTEQAAYHSRNGHAKHRAARFADRAGLGFFCLTFAMATMHLLGVGHGHGDEDASSLGLLITAAAIILPAWGATIHAINTLLETERIAVRSAQMAKVLERVALRAEQADTPADFEEVIAQAESLMLLESHEWWVTLSFRPPVLPA